MKKFLLGLACISSSLLYSEVDQEQLSKKMIEAAERAYEADSKKVAHLARHFAKKLKKSIADDRAPLIATVESIKEKFLEKLEENNVQLERKALSVEEMDAQGEAEDKMLTAVMQCKRSSELDKYLIIVGALMWDAPDRSEDDEDCDGYQGLATPWKMALFSDRIEAVRQAMVKALYHNTASESAVNSETLPIMVGHFWFAFGLSCADDQELWNTLFNSDYFKLLRQTLTQEEKEYVSIFINDFFRVFYLSNFDIEFKKQAKILNSSISESALKDEVAQELGLMEKRYEWSDQLYFKEDITSEEFAELDTLFRQRLMLKRLEIIQESCPLFVELQQINQRLDKNRVIAELQAYAEKQASSLVYTQENLRKARFTVESFFSEFIKELKK